MSDEIKIDLYHFNSEVSRLRNQKTGMTYAIESVKYSLDELVGMWDGAGGSAYEDALDCIKAGFIENSRSLEQLIDSLEYARDKVINADAAGAR